MRGCYFAPIALTPATSALAERTIIAPTPLSRPRSVIVS